MRKRDIVLGLIVIGILSALAGYNLEKRNNEDKKKETREEVEKNEENKKDDLIIKTIPSEDGEEKENIYDNYNQYVSLIADEISTSDMGNTLLEAFAAYLVLEDNGLISLGNSCASEEPDFEYYDDLAMGGIAIPVGKGVCRNRSANLYQILNKMGFNCGISLGELYKKGEANFKANHMTVFAEENGIVYLLDPYNKTIYVRDVLGRYRSIKNDEIFYTPKILTDQKYEVNDTNLDLYMNFSDDYSQAMTHRFHLTNSLQKAYDNMEYYASYEESYLKTLEESINKSTNELINKEKELTKKAN